MATADINPEFITAANVSKEGMRQQLRHIKDALSRLDALNPWQVVDTVLLLAPANSVNVDLPNGFNRYRIEFQDVRGTADGILHMRMSSDGVNFYVGGGDYDGAHIDVNVTGTQAGNPGGTPELSLTVVQDSEKPGIFGSIEMPFTRNQGVFTASCHRPDNLRQLRQGCFGTAGTNNVAAGFLINGGSTQFAGGSSFTVMARL